jgi:hypothetical protein
VLQPPDVLWSYTLLNWNINFSEHCRHQCVKETLQTIILSSTGTGRTEPNFMAGRFSVPREAHLSPTTDSTHSVTALLSDTELTMQSGRAMAQAVSRRQTYCDGPGSCPGHSHEICGGQSGNGTYFSLTSTFPCQYHSTMDLHTHI